MSATERIKTAWTGGDREGTHWEGCYVAHPNCAVVQLVARIEELEAAALRDPLCLQCFGELNASEGKPRSDDREHEYVASCSGCGHSMGEGG